MVLLGPLPIVLAAVLVQDSWQVCGVQHWGWQGVLHLQAPGLSGLVNWPFALRALVSVIRNIALICGVGRDGSVRAHTFMTSKLGGSDILESEVVHVGC